MSLMDYFRSSRPKSASIAKERLQILVAHERSERHQPEYLAALQKDLLEVIRKYVNIDPSAISVSLEQDETREVLELNIVLPEEVKPRRRTAR